MDTTNNSETPQRRVDDRAPAATINWEAPGAPAVPVRQPQPAAPGFLTNEQIGAGAEVKCDHGQPIGRNVAIDVFDAMTNAAPVASGAARIERATAPHGSAAPTEAEAWAVLAESGNVIYWEHDRAKVEEVAARHGRPFGPYRPAPQRAAAPVSGGELHHNFYTHKGAWRSAIEFAINESPATGLGDDDPIGYWRHELSAYDEAFGSLPPQGAAVSASQAAPTAALPPVICTARPFPTTDKATIHFARDVTDAELLAVNQALNAKLNNPHYSAAPVEQGQGAAPSEKAALEVRISNLRTALREVSETRFGYNGDCGVTKIADDALYADEQAELASPAPVGAGVVPEKLTRSMCGTKDYCQGWNDCVDEFARLAAATAHPVAADDQVRDQALEEAAALALKFTAVPRDVLGPATLQMKTLAAVGEKLAAAIRAKKSASRTTAHGGAQGEK